MKGNALLMIDSISWAMEESAFNRLRAIADRAHNPTDRDLEVLERVSGTWHDKAEGQLTTRGGVATIEVSGPIFRHANLLTRVSGATSTEALARDFATAMDDDEIHSVIFEINSPGGEATAISELARSIRSARGTKPIIARGGGFVCSGAYWIASAADRIIVSDTAFLGSIGVVQRYRDTKGLQAKMGVIEGEVVSSNAPNKWPDPTTEAGKKLYQREVDDLEEVFITEIAAGRGVTREKVIADFGKGGIMIAAEAVKSGMADALGDYEPTHAALVADHRAKAEARQKSQLGGFRMAGETTSSVSIADADDINRRLAAAEQRAREADERNAALLRQRDEDQRERATERADTLAMSYLRADDNGRAAMLPRQRDSFVALHAALATIDRTSPFVEDGAAVKLAARLEQFVSAGARHDLLAHAEDGTEADPDNPAVKDALAVLARSGMKVVGAGEPRRVAADDVQPGDRDHYKMNGRTA